MKRPHGRSSLPPIRRKFPFCLRGKALLGPRIIGVRILPSDVDHRMIFTTRNAAAGAFGMRSPGTMRTYRANQGGHWLAENQRPGSQNLAGGLGVPGGTCFSISSQSRSHSATKGNIQQKETLPVSGSVGAYSKR
jgi:hypothetical protein